MARPREVRDTFQTLIGQNQKVIAALDTTLTQTRKQRAALQKVLLGQVQDIATRLLEPLDRASLDKLASVSGSKNIGHAYDAAIAAGVVAQREYDSYVDLHGDEKALRKVLQDAQHALSDANGRTLHTTSARARLGRDLVPAQDFAKAYPGKCGLSSQSDVDYFSSKKGLSHIWAAMTDAHYRKGRALLKLYAQSGLSTVALFAKDAELAQTLKDQSAEAAHLTAQAEKADTTLDRAETLAKNLVTEADIIARLHTDIVSQLRDRVTLDRANILLPAHVTADLIEKQVKIDALERLERRLGAQEQGLKKVNTSLSAPISKLNTAVSRGVHKDIRIDLPDTVAKVRRAQVAGQYLASEGAKATTRIARFSHTSPRLQMAATQAGLPAQRSSEMSVSEMLTMYLVYDMLATSAGDLPAVDAAAVQMTLGVPEAVSAAADIDLATLAPQLDAQTLQGLEGLGGGIDVSSLDSVVSSIDVSVPDIGSIDVSVPDVSISVPDIHVDTGSSWDSGSSFGGGFD